MLNEIKEFEEYTNIDLLNDKNKKPRLTPSVFGDIRKSNKVIHMTGLSRAMVIIARGKLCDRSFFDSSDDVERESIIEEVKSDLKKWLGFVDDNSGSWMKKYYDVYQLENKCSWDDLKELKQKQFEIAWNYASGKKGDDTSNAVSYDYVIAEAINRGPLKKYYMLCKRDANRNVTKIIKGNEVTLNPDKGTNDPKAIDALFKLIAAYLIEKDYSRKSSEILIEHVDLGNWVQITTISNEFKKYYTKFTAVQNVDGKITLGKYIDDFDFKLVDASKLKEIPEGYVAYEDFGSGQLLGLKTKL